MAYGGVVDINFLERANPDVLCGVIICHGVDGLAWFDLKLVLESGALPDVGPALDVTGPHDLF